MITTGYMIMTTQNKTRACEITRKVSETKKNTLFIVKKILNHRIVAQLIYESV